MYKISIFLALSFFVFSSAYTHPLLDTNQIEHLTGAKGEFDIHSGVFKVIVPRPELKISSIGVKLTPALGLTSEVSFQPIGSDVEVTGNVILLEDQVNLVMKTALDHGFNITALHNYYLWDIPRVMVMHMEGKGKVHTLATAVGNVFETIKKTSKGSIWNLSPSPLDTARSTIEPKTINAILETEGTLKDGVYKIVWDKTNQIGNETWAAFSGTDKQAVLLGDLAVKEDAVQNVLNILLKHKIFIISLHQRMMRDGSKIVVIHYMGRGLLVALATALKDTLGATQSKVQEKS